MRFFTLYKFELKKISFMAFAALFTMYFSSICTFSSNLNQIFNNYLGFNFFYNITLKNNISSLNLIWIAILAFLQFNAFDFKAKGNLPFDTKSLFKATIFAGMTIIVISILFYYLISGYELFKYRSLLAQCNTALNGLYLFKNIFLAFSLDIVFVLLMLLAFYFFSIIFLLLFKNSIFSMLILGGFNLFFYLIAYSSSNVFFKALSFLSWFHCDDDPLFISILHTVYGNLTYNPYYLLLALIFALSLSFMLYFLAVSLFAKKENTTLNIFSKHKLGVIIVFLTIAMILFYIMTSTLNQYFYISGYKKLVIIILSVIISSIIVYITNYLELKKVVKYNE